MAKPESRSRATPEQVAEFIREIRRYHEVGQRIFNSHQRTYRYGENVFKKLADQLGWNETKTRKAAQFAHSTEGYNQKQIATLFDQLRKHQPVFGTAHIGILVTVSWAKGRANLQRWCIQNNKSKSELEAEIMRRLGPRRQGGRRRAVAAERGHLLVQLGEMADTWLRWHKAATDVQEDNGTEEKAFNQLTSEVQQHVNEVNQAMLHLHETVSRKLRVFRAKLE